MKRIFLLATILLVATNVMAQNRVTGRIAGEDDGKPLDYAEVLAIAGEEIVQDVRSGLDGAFEMFVEKGEYIIEVKYIGYETSKQNPLFYRAFGNFLKHHALYGNLWL